MRAMRHGARYPLVRSCAHAWDVARQVEELASKPSRYVSAASAPNCSTPYAVECRRGRASACRSTPIPHGAASCRCSLSRSRASPRSLRGVAIADTARVRPSSTSGCNLGEHPIALLHLAADEIAHEVAARWHSARTRHAPRRRLSFRRAERCSSWPLEFSFAQFSKDWQRLPIAFVLLIGLASARAAEEAKRPSATATTSRPMTASSARSASARPTSSPMSAARSRRSRPPGGCPRTTSPG